MSIAPLRGLPGPTYGTILDRRRGERVTLRTPPRFVVKYGRSYIIDDDGIHATGAQGTQFWVQRKDALHKGEDVYIPPGSPVYAPFDGTVTAIYQARAGTFAAQCSTCGTDYGTGVDITSSVDPGIVTRLIHLRDVKVKKGDKVAMGIQIGRSYTPARFPGKDPSHVHVEAILDRQPGEKGNAQPYAVFDVEALYTPKTAPLPLPLRGLAPLLLGIIVGAAAGGLALLALSEGGGGHG